MDNLIALGIPGRNIYIYERFPGQLSSVHYDRSLLAGINIVAAETTRGSSASYDPNTYVETNFFGEDDTRSNMKLVLAGAGPGLQNQRGALRVAGGFDSY